MAAPQPPLPPADPPRRMSGPALAFVLSLLWLGAVVAVAAVLTRRGQSLGDALGLVVIAQAVVLPVVLIWLGVLMLRASAAMAAQAARIEALAARLNEAPPPLPLVAPVARNTDEALALFVSRREAAQAGLDAAPGQRGLALDPPRAAAPLGTDDLIRALDFPRDAADAQGFDLLRRALHDPNLADLVRAAEAVLSGLSAEGIEVRDLAPDRARPEVWRAFAQGARGPAVAALGGIRERAVLAQAAARMRAEPAFREAAHRFLRAFDLRLAAFETVASDAQIVRLAETRASRAFMILGRVTGIFG
jgi:hypothetical protein